MKHIKIFPLFSLVLWLMFAASIVGCASGDKAVIADPEVYTEQAAMSIMMQDAEHALALIDSAVMAENITLARADYLRACVYYCGKNDAASAKYIALQLFEEKCDDVLAEDVCVLLASIAHSAGDDVGVMQYAPRAFELAEANEHFGDVGQMSSYIAQTIAHQGQIEEAINMTEEVVRDLEARNTWDCMVAYMSAVKSMLNLLCETDHSEDMIATCQQALEHLAYFEQNEHLFSGVPTGFSPDEFLDMSRAQIYAILCIAYSKLGMRSEALQAEREALSTQYGQHGRVHKILLSAWLELGEWDKFDEAVVMIEKSYSSDTINNNYYIYLRNCSVAAERRGRTAEALSLERRAASVQDSLTTRYMQQQIAEQATLHKLHEATLAKQKAESRTHQIVILLNISVFVVLIAVAFSVYALVTRRKTRLKNKALVRLIDEQQSLQTIIEQTAEVTADVAESKNEASDLLLYEHLCAIIVENNLYSDLSLDRDKVAEMLGIRRPALNQLLNQYANGQSFPQWLNDIRIKEACRLLKNNREMTISDVAAAVGLTPQNLRIIFRQHLGMTPSEYRNTILEPEESLEEVEEMH